MADHSCSTRSLSQLAQRGASCRLNTPPQGLTNTDALEHIAAGHLDPIRHLFLHVFRVLTSHTLLGISFKTQALYVTVFVVRYLDLFFTCVSYNFIMKVFFISSSVYILYLIESTLLVRCPSTSFACKWLNFIAFTRMPVSGQQMTHP